MSSRRDQITMSDAEVLEFLDGQKVVVCATNGRSGWPHVMPLWYVVRDGEIWAWTFAKSQKVRNLERDPRATVQVEDGEQYAELRGVAFECDVVLHAGIDDVARLGLDIMSRYLGGPLGTDAEAAIGKQAAKRVGLQFVERRRSTWDHRKLGGVY